MRNKSAKALASGFVLIAALAILVTAVVAAAAAVSLSATVTGDCNTFDLSISAGGLTPGAVYSVVYNFTLTSPSNTGDCATATQDGTLTLLTADMNGNLTGGKIGRWISGGDLTPGCTVTGTVSLYDSTGNLVSTQSITISTSLSCGPGSAVTADGRFTGGGKQVGVGVGADGLPVIKVTKGLELDCDVVADVAAGVSGSNNLEINWSDATGEHKFHMEHFVSASCYNDLDFSPNPPVAPIDVMIGVGTGRVDGVLGYTVEFTLEDHGEPGRSDQAAFLIYQGMPGTPPAIPAGCPYFSTPTGDPLVLDFPTNYPTVLPQPPGPDPGTPCNATLSLLSDGNLQAHPDQH